MKLHNLRPLLLSLSLLLTLIPGSSEDERKRYIVYMGHLPEEAAITYEDLESQHHNLLEAAIGEHHQLAREFKIHSYSRSFNGFVARLLPHEVEKLKEKEGVVSVFANTLRKLHTTRSWDFVGMPLQVERRRNKESDIVVGILDTGIYIDSPSFNDEGYGPPPSSWKGKCVKGRNFTRGCNNKVIGARYYNLGEGPYDENLSPVDDDGHGTHTASTVAGVAVAGASFYDIGKGTARGGVPSARIAAYKICWSQGCDDMDILAAFDDAIADGVDIISLSLGGPSTMFFEDSIAIGAFHAMKSGILTSCSAGNDGPTAMTVQNVAPWILTVAASSIDRQFTTEVALGNGQRVSGISINTFSSGNKMYPLTSGALVANNNDGNGNASSCEYGTMAEEKVKGKIVFCLEGSDQEYSIKLLGGVGTIMDLTYQTDVAHTTLLPATYVQVSAGKIIERYINSTKNPRAIIHKTRTKTVPAPFLASFSSKGPDSFSPHVLKPDLAAPGVHILASYSKLTTVTGYPYPDDARYYNFNIISGTSMACPHASAAAAYVKSFHPDWSPAAIRSALMTTATPLKIGGDNLTELGSGSGQINPTAAIDPGLVYDATMDSYVALLCKYGYNNSVIGLIVGSKKVNCNTVEPAQGIDGINYPSMNVNLRTNTSRIAAWFHRTVTNVGHGTSTYRAKVKAPRGLSVRVEPQTLHFTHLNQTKTFRVVLKGPPLKNGTHMLSALLEWNDCVHNVRSPIIVNTPFSLPVLWF